MGSISKKEKEMKKEFRSFESAREFVRSLGLKTEKEWLEYCKSGNKPNNIPTSPKITYKNNWSSMGDWLGTGNIANKNHIFQNFEDAKKYVYKLNLKGQKEWLEYCKSGNKPNNIPSNPGRTYKKEGWITWGDWLGNEKIAKQNMSHLPFNEARKFVQTLNLKGEKEWLEYCKSGNKPNNIPFNPRGVYKNKGWKGTGNWLGTDNVAPKNMLYLPFKDAKKFVQSLGLKGSKDWRRYSKSKKRPKDIPAAPDRTYKKEGWITWGDFFGTETVAPGLRQYRSFNEARDFVRKLGLKNYEEWEKYCKSGKKPEDIPSTPWGVYKEWKKK
jgi:hypothetical protein